MFSLSTLDLTEKKIRGFSALPVGWHYGNGGPVSAKQMNRALTFLSWFRFLDFSQTDAFSSVDGDVMITAYAGDHYFEVDLTVDDGVGFRHLKSEIELFSMDGVTDDDAVEVIEKVVKRSGCDTFDLFIPAPMTRSVKGSTAMLLRIPVQNAVVGAQAYLNTIAPEEMPMSAHIVVNSISKYQESPRSFGSLMNRPYRQAAA